MRKLLINIYGMNSASNTGKKILENKIMIKPWLLSIFTALGFAFSFGPIHAIPLLEGDTFNLSFEDTTNNVRLDGMVSVTTLLADQIVLDVILSNPLLMLDGATSTDNSGRAVSLGFDFIPSAPTNSVNNVTMSGGSVFADSGWGNVNISGGFRVDVCAFAGNRCNAGGSGGDGTIGLNRGESDSFTLDIRGLFDLSNIDLGGYVSKWQSVGPGGISFTTTGSSTPTTSLPEPSTLALLGIGMLGIGVVRKRMKN